MAPLSPQSSHFGLIFPLCTSSATIGLALYQFPVFTAFLSKDRDLSGKALSRYWKPIFQQGHIVITGLGVASTLSGILAARWLHTHATLETSEVGRMYTFGAALAAAHFAFVPLVARPINRMIERGEGGAEVSEENIKSGNEEDMKTWFMWHTVRTLAVDLPALIFFAEGAAKSFWISNV